MRQRRNRRRSRDRWRRSDGTPTVRAREGASARYVDDQAMRTAGRSTVESTRRRGLMRSPQARSRVRRWPQGRPNHGRGTACQMGRHTKSPGRRPLVSARDIRGRHSPTSLGTGGGTRRTYNGRENSGEQLAEACSGPATIENAISDLRQICRWRRRASDGTKPCAGINTRVLVLSCHAESTGRGASDA